MSETDQTPATRTTAERLELAEERERKAAAHRDRLRRVSTAEAEVPGVWGQPGVTKSKLADTYGVSTATISRILEVAGVPQTRVRQLTDEERKEIAELLRTGTTSLEIQAAYGVSHNTVRNIGLKAGVLKPGERKPQRSDEEYRQIQELDQLAIQRFGSGLYNLGVGLRTWERKQQVAAEGTPHEQEKAYNDAVQNQSPEPTVEVSTAPAEETTPTAPPASPPLTEDEWVNPDPPMQTSAPAEGISSEAPAEEEPDFKF